MAGPAALHLAGTGPWFAGIRILRTGVGYAVERWKKDDEALARDLLGPTSYEMSR
jgi:hypothetical protein